MKYIIRFDVRIDNKGQQNSNLFFTVVELIKKLMLVDYIAVGKIWKATEQKCDEEL